jgi:hypothetical protein
VDLLSDNQSDDDMPELVARFRPDEASGYDMPVLVKRQLRQPCDIDLSDDESDDEYYDEMDDEAGDGASGDDSDDKLMLPCPPRGMPQNHHKSVINRCLPQLSIHHDTSDNESDDKVGSRWSI